MKNAVMEWGSDGVMIGKNQRPCFLFITPSLHYSITPSVLAASQHPNTPTLQHPSTRPVAAC